MKFLIEYDREGSKLLRRRQFPLEAELTAAYQEAERDYLLAGREVEVVVLEADSLEELVVTHGRYFKTLGEIGSTD